MISDKEIFRSAGSGNPFSKKVAYFSMEYAIDQALRTYSGGLGFLAGSHMRSAREQNMNLVGIGILWKYGYYDQIKNENGHMKSNYVPRNYSFLQDIGLTFPITIHNANVYVKVFYLAPEVFGSAPMFFMSTDIPENDFLSRTITERLYDADNASKVAASIVLGVGGGKLLDLLNMAPDIYHLNEGHGLPLLFYLYSKYRDVNEVKKRFVFTTHTPEKAGNEEQPMWLLEKMSFFCNIPLDEVRKITKESGENLDYTLTALRFAKKANAVSKLHSKVSQEMWSDKEGVCPIVPITNAQNKQYWKDNKLEEALNKNDNMAIIERKKKLKKQLFREVLDHTGKLLDPNVLTIVWARRFAGYKRADLILRNYDRFLNLVSRHKDPIQVIWAGKPYPLDQGGINTFNRIIECTKDLKNCAVMTGYELRLSALLKKGSDVWLNNPRITREASGTSGMTAAMNGSINFSIPDGWVPEFSVHCMNSFVIPPADHHLPVEMQDENDYRNLMQILESEVIPTYYNHRDKWVEMMKAGMRDVVPNFDSDRMAIEYYEKLYSAD